MHQEGSRLHLRVRHTGFLHSQAHQLAHHTLHQDRRGRRNFQDTSSRVPFGPFLLDCHSRVSVIVPVSAPSWNPLLDLDPHSLNPRNLDPRNLDPRNLDPHMKEEVDIRLLTWPSLVAFAEST